MGKRALFAFIFALGAGAGLGSAQAQDINPTKISPNIVSGVSTGLTYFTLVGPCDIYGAAGTPCIAAQSVTRRLFGGYNGYLFVLHRDSDNSNQNIGTLPNGIYNAGAVSSFCAGTTCYIRQVFDQSGSNVSLVRPSVSQMAPWITHPTFGLPVVVANGKPASFYTSVAPIPTGNTSVSVYELRSTEQYSTGFVGEYGWGYVNNTPTGVHFAIGYNNQGTIAGTGLGSILGFGVDLGNAVASTTNASVPTLVGLVGKYNSTTGYMSRESWNATQGTVSTLATWLPTATPNLYPYTGIGQIVTASFGVTHFFEGAMIQGASTSAADAAVATNAAAFYSTQLPSYVGPADTVLESGGCGTGSSFPCGLEAAVGGAWGLRLLRASYTGPSALIQRASDSTTLAIQPTPTGDFDDASAQAFCASTTCTIARLYNQALTLNGNNTNPSVYDLVQGTGANQFSLVFNDINGRAAMRGAGSAIMCTSTSISTIGPSWTMVAVATRSGNFTTQQFVVDNNDKADGSLGFAATANTSAFAIGTASLTASATDSSWNFLQGSITAASGTASLSVNNGTAATGSGTGMNSIGGYTCVGGTGPIGSPTNEITGDVAEVLIFSPLTSATQLTGLYNNEHIYYGGAF